MGIDINKNIDNAKGGILKSYTLSDKTLKWLREDLKNNTLPCLVFSHYGIANISMKNNYWFGKDDRSAELAFYNNKNEIFNILENDKNVIASFCGHQHWTKEISDYNKKYFVIGSLTENINNDGTPDGSYFVIDLNKSNINVAYKKIKQYDF